IAANGTWTYALDNTKAATNALAQGAHATDVFTYTMQDANGATSTTTLTIAIDGTNDLPTISQVAPTVTLVEAGVGPGNTAVAGTGTRSEERRVGKEGRADSASFDHKGGTRVSDDTDIHAAAFASFTSNN